ncbi:GtrA family protein [Actinacidiphila oryziradicis]|jgi:putative flippase GtrA|uniref:GtrA family protein n=1 Tax=Actinacidiphila oryziradicis TaxID=2571141 RepID=A0A4U0SJR4_9ACTN|nr:GtrA family protein [Actinacidiphila oryziradicis]MCW2871748.1 rane protein [Actinacidiphila oryziradicis]TKA10070.1 GtrA family protein [Actinacidiphila oryziradicis]
MGGSTGLSARPKGLQAGLGRLFREIAKFGLVGIAGIFVNLGVTNVLWHVTHLAVVRASIIGTLVAIVFNYVGFRYFTYRDRDRQRRGKELGLFLFFSAIGLVIENGVLFTATYGMGWNSQVQSNIFKFVGIGVATLFRFWSYRSWVFKALPAREAVEQAESFLEAVQTEPHPGKAARTRN